MVMRDQLDTPFDLSRRLAYSTGTSQDTETIALLCDSTNCVIVMLLMVSMFVAVGLLFTEMQVPDCRQLESIASDRRRTKSGHSGNGA